MKLAHKMRYFADTKNNRECYIKYEQIITAIRIASAEGRYQYIVDGCLPLVLNDKLEDDGFSMYYDKQTNKTKIIW